MGPRRRLLPRPRVDRGVVARGGGAHGVFGVGPGSADELMRISVNLANRPFVELRPLFARLRLGMGVLAALAVGLGFALHSLNANASVARARMDAVKAEGRQYLHERQVNEARM